MQQHAALLIAHAEAGTGFELPRFIKDGFNALLERGILANGFLRLRCGECGHDNLRACQLREVASEVSEAEEISERSLQPARPV